MRKVDAKAQARLIINAIEKFIAGTGTLEALDVLTGGIDLHYALSDKAVHCDRCESPHEQTYLPIRAEDGNPSIDHKQDGEILCYRCALAALREVAPCPTCCSARPAALEAHAQDREASDGPV